jgi:PAS domain S-box-containing protein
MFLSDLPYRDLLDATPDGLVVCDAKGKILLVNAEAARMFGYGQDEMVGKPVDMLVPAAVRHRHDAYIAGFTGAPRLRPMGSGLDLKGTRKDGSEFPVEISLSPIETSRGLLITAGIRDVTERRTLEGEKRRATAYLTSAVDAVQDAFALFDEQDRLVMVNSAGRELLGSEYGPPIVGLPFAEVLRNALGSGTFDTSHETSDSFYERWLSYHQAPSGTIDVRTGRGRYLRVTERKTAEHGTVAMIADVTDDVLRAEELRAARETAEAASAAKSEFLSSMSHELRTPMNAILGFAQLLERDRKNPLDPRQIERLQYVLRGGEHLLRLIDDVLDLAKIEAGRITISVEPVGVPGLMQEVVSTLEPMATRAEIHIASLRVPEVVPTVLADRTRLAQILMNFGSNAIKYGRRGGHVSFEVTPVANKLRITVTDDGIGIPDDKRHKLFEPFQRAGQEAGAIEGTGIGLSISKRLAELMNGAVGFTSTAGVGSQFWVEIPVHDATTSEAGIAVQQRGESSTLTSESDARYKVVYVEDNPSNIAFMRDLIGELPRADLLVAPTAEIGLELIRTHRPAVVIMDINLPGMSGFDAVKALRAWPETRDIPVIGLSAAALARDTGGAQAAGFHRYLTKPVKVDELTRVLEELLARRI